LRPYIKKGRERKKRWWPKAPHWERTTTTSNWVSLPQAGGVKERKRKNTKASTHRGTQRKIGPEGVPSKGNGVKAAKKFISVGEDKCAGGRESLHVQKGAERRVEETRQKARSFNRHRR